MYTVTEQLYSGNIQFETVACLSKKSYSLETKLLNIHTQPWIALDIFPTLSSRSTIKVTAGIVTNDVYVACEDDITLLRDHFVGSSV